MTIEHPCCSSLTELSDYVVLPASLKALLVEKIIIKKATGQLGHGSQPCDKSWKFKNPQPESRSLSLNMWERACHKPLSLMKGPVHWWRVQVPTAWLIRICLLLSLPFHGQWVDDIAGQLLWERYGLKSGRMKDRHVTTYIAECIPVISDVLVNRYEKTNKRRRYTGVLQKRVLWWIQMHLNLSM